jgi:signal transduction histidine kinase
VLLSAAGLLALGMISLWSALQDAEQGQRFAAERAARFTARELADALADPTLLQSLPATQRFTLDADGLALPEGWQSPRSEDPRFAMPSLLALKLGEAQRLEYAGDGTRAAELLAELQQTPGIEARLRSHFALARAWLAHRQGEFVARDQLLDEMDSLDESAFAEDLAGIILLSAASGRELPSWTEERLAFLEDPTLSALHLRLQDHGRMEEADSIRAASEDLIEQRRSLRLAATQIDELRSAAESVVLPIEGRILVFHPEGDRRGQGAQFTPEFFLETLTGDSSPWLSAPFAGLPLYGDAISAEAIPVVPSALALLPEPVQPSNPLLGPYGLAALLLLLGLSMVLSLTAMLRSMGREAHALRARSEFLTSVTHELKTPLASIRLLAERLDEGRVTDMDQARRYYSLLAGEAARLSVLIENVLDLGRMERGERAYDLQKQDVVEVLSEAVELFRPLAQADGLEFAIDLPVDPCPAQLDRAAFNQALVNLLENARKYAAKGKRIELSAERREKQLLVRLRDHGPGVPISERERIFERFCRGAAQAHGGIPGVGLGLYLSREILRAHGGELEYADPESGEGSVFVLRLPLSPQGVTLEPMS